MNKIPYGRALVIRISDSAAPGLKASLLICTAACIVITAPAPTLMTPLHKSTSCCGAVDSWRLTTPSPPPPPPPPLGSLSFQWWVIGSAESEKKKRGGGTGAGRGWFIQGSRLPRPIPSLLSLLWQFSPEYLTCLDPEPRPLCASLWPQSHLSHQCSFLTMNV